MKKIGFYILLILIIMAACENPNYDHHLDPASNYYMPIIEKKLIIIDFEGDFSQSIWGWKHGIFELNNGKIDTVCIKDQSDPARGQILKLIYDVSANDSSQACWFQPLGYSNKGTFNLLTTGLNYLTFYAKGDKGGEKFWVTITDINDNNTDPPPENITPLTVNWEIYKIPLADLLTDMIDPKNITSFDITFENGNGPTKGIVYVDEFAFEWE